MSVQAMTWVIENAEVGGSELLILLLLANAAHADGTHAYPGRKRLAREARMSERQVVRLCNRLVEKGVIRHEGRSHLRTNEYSLVGIGQVSELSRTQGDNLAPPTVTTRHASGDIPNSGGDIERQGGDKSGRGGDIAISSNPSLDPFNNPSLERSTASKSVEQGRGRGPVFDGRDLYKFHSELIGFPSTPAQRNLIDKYVGWADEDYGLVARAMELVPNPRRRGWLGEVGDYIRAVRGMPDRKVAA